MPKGGKHFGKHVGKVASKGSSSFYRSTKPGPSSVKSQELSPSVVSVLDELKSLIKQTQVGIN